jgi:MFS family permease
VANTFRDSLGLLGTRRFGTFWFASLLSSIGTWAQQVAQPWLLLTLGASSFLIGLDSFAMNAPVLLLTLAGGALADRADRRRVIALFQSIQMLCPTAIVALMITGAVKPWMIIALSVVVGVTDALSMPSFSSIVPTIVPRERIAAGLALNSTQFSLSRILGPSIAGVLMSSVGAVACFVVSALSYVPFIGVALWILPKWRPATHAEAAARRANPLAGTREILREPHLRGALATVLITAVLCGPIVTFTPVLVRDVYHGSAAQFSAAVAAFGVGGLIGATGLLSVPSTTDRRRITSGFALALATLVAVTALSPTYWLVPPLLALAGICMTVSNISSNTLVQSTTAPSRLGRTVGLYMLAMRGGLSIGALVTGASVTLLGVQRALVLNGVLAVVLQSALSRWWIRAPIPAERAA